MNGSRQGDLFTTASDLAAAAVGGVELPLLRHQLQEWQRALARHQTPLFAGTGEAVQQVGLFEALETSPPALSPDTINPLQLRA
ncbi:MAG: GIY-YIG nuclease family protein, partial [Synechococcaceae cyanobacterium]